MLSAIGRAAVRRVVVTAPQSTNRTRQSIWRLQGVDALQKVDNVSTQSNLAFSFRRSYVTATKAAPKKSAAKKPAAKKPAARKSAAKPKTKKAAPKKAVKKKVVKKAKPKVLKKKVLTEEEKTRLEVRKLKEAALSPPKDKPASAWTVLLSETHASSEGKRGKNEIGEVATASAAKYKSLAPAELEAYNHIANQNKAANELALKKWIESHTPDQIRLANNARKQLRRKLPSARKYPLIPDDRAPKRPTNAMIYYMKEKRASGDLKGLKIIESTNLLAQEWKNLSASERKPFEDVALASKQRYAQELKTVFNRDVSH